MKDFSKENVRAVIERIMKKYNVENLYDLKSGESSLDVQDGLEFFTDCCDKKFCKELALELSDIDNDIWTCVTPLLPEDKERMLSMLHPIYLGGEFVGYDANKR